MPVRLLVTGFEPFGGSALNPSRELLTALRSTPLTGATLSTELLPVVGGTAPGSAAQRLLDAVSRDRPELLVCLGETGSRAAICVERIAVNRRDYRIADNAGAIVRDEPIVPAAPARLESTLPTEALVEAIRSVDVPCELSTNAGLFLCNEIMFHAIEIALRHDIRAAGFIHVPRLPEQNLGAHSDRPSMPLSRMLLGIRAALERLVAPLEEPREGRRATFRS